MKKRSLFLLPILALAFAGSARIASAHECTYDGAGRDEGNQVECHETPIMPNWRDGNYVPLFDLQNRDDLQQREDAQRWREECEGYDTSGNYHSDQLCAWARGGYSHTPPNSAPTEGHAGFAASHCFLGEFAHQCEDHDKRNGEGVHDAHGGATYVDVCAAANPESKYCNDGPKDTQAGVTIMDHNACGTIIPIVACTDEYHVIRPLDSAYTQEQMTDSAAYIQKILADPELYLCGYKQYRSGNPICPEGTDAHVHRHGAYLHVKDGVFSRRVTLTPRADGSILAHSRLETLELTRLDASARETTAASGAFMVLFALGAVALRARRLFALS